MHTRSPYGADVSCNTRWALPFACVSSPRAAGTKKNHLAADLSKIHQLLISRALDLAPIPSTEMWRTREQPPSVHSRGYTPTANNSGFLRRGSGRRNWENILVLVHHFLRNLRGLPGAPNARILPRVPMHTDLIKYEQTYG